MAVTITRQSATTLKASRSNCEIFILTYRHQKAKTEHMKPQEKNLDQKDSKILQGLSSGDSEAQNGNFC